MSNAQASDAGLPPENDPLHDINGPQVITWLVGASVVLFIGLFILYALFAFSVEDVRNESVGAAPTVERSEVFAQEAEILGGAMESGSTAKDINMVIQEMAGN